MVLDKASSAVSLRSDQETPMLFVFGSTAGLRGGNGAVCMEVPLCDPPPPSSAVRSGFLRTRFLCVFCLLFLGRVRLHSCLTLSKCFPRGPSAAVLWCVVKTCHPKSSAKTSLVYSKRSLSPSRAGLAAATEHCEPRSEKLTYCQIQQRRIYRKRHHLLLFFSLLFSRDVTW